MDWWTDHPLSTHQRVLWLAFDVLPNKFYNIWHLFWSIHYPFLFHHNRGISSSFKQHFHCNRNNMNSHTIWAVTISWHLRLSIDWYPWSTLNWHLIGIWHLNRYLLAILVDNQSRVCLFLQTCHWVPINTYESVWTVPTMQWMLMQH